MCAPSVIQTALAGLSRRELLQVAAGLAAGLSSLAAAGGVTPVSRSFSSRANCSSVP